MKKILILVVVMLFVATSVSANTVVGSKHDMKRFVTNEGTTQVCVFCHVPHQAASANRQEPLWNKSLSLATYTVYSSATLNNTPLTPAVTAPGAASNSALCLSCHDGTVGVNVLYRTPMDGIAGTSISVTGNPNLGTDLRDDHPVNFSYLTQADGGLDSQANAAADNMRFFNNTLQCGTCHNVHDNINFPFLRTSNANSILCLACHLK